MKITVNGKTQEVEDGLTVTGLLGLLQLDSSRVAVERNQDVVPRTEFPRLELLDQDIIEVVQFVGGG